MLSEQQTTLSLLMIRVLHFDQWIIPPLDRLQCRHHIGCKRHYDCRVSIVPVQTAELVSPFDNTEYTRHIQCSCLLIQWQLSKIFWPESPYMLEVDKRSGTKIGCQDMDKAQHQVLTQVQNLPSANTTAKTIALWIERRLTQQDTMHLVRP